MTTLFRHVALVALVSLLLGGPAAVEAQLNGQMKFIVRDLSGRPVPQALVQVFGIDGGFLAEDVADDAGFASLPGHFAEVVFRLDVIDLVGVPSCESASFESPLHPIGRLFWIAATSLVAPVDLYLDCVKLVPYPIGTAGGNPVEHTGGPLAGSASRPPDSLFERQSSWNRVFGLQISLDVEGRQTVEQTLGDQSTSLSTEGFTTDLGQWFFAEMSPGDSLELAAAELPVEAPAELPPTKHGAFAVPLISGTSLNPAVHTVTVAEDGTSGTPRRQVLSSFSASSADAVPTPEEPTVAVSPEVVFGWRERSLFVTYEATSLNGEIGFAFDRSLVPLHGLLGGFDGGYQAEFVVQPTSRATDPVLWNFGSFFTEIKPLSPTASCAAPFTDQGTVMLHGWRGEELLYAEELYGIDGTFGFLCSPPGFTASAGADEMGFFAVNEDQRLRVVGKRLTEPAEPAVIVDMGPIPAIGTSPVTPAAIADGTSGSVVFGAPGRGLFGWSDDSHRLGQDPWPLDVAPIEVQLDLGFPFELTTDRSGIGGYLVGRYRDTDLVPRDRVVSGPDRVTSGRDSSRDSVAATSNGTVAAFPVLGEVPLTGCLTTDGAVCLNHQRFSVRASYVLQDGTRGPAHARQLSVDSGTFWFFDKDNRELIVKVLDGCGVNGNFWFFAAGLTNVGVQLTVRDELTGESKFFGTTAGEPFAPLLRTDTFPCSAEDASRSELRARQARSSETFPRSHGDVVRVDGMSLSGPQLDSSLSEGSGATGSACGGGADALCLGGGRFRVDIDWTDFSGGTGTAFGGRLTRDTGALFFFDRSNVEMLVKVLDACSFNGRFWVFAGALTNVGVSMTVTDTTTGTAKTYTNDLGVDFATITDTESFPC